MGTVHALGARLLERSEADLISAACRGHGWAKQALFERYVRAAYDRAVRLLGGAGNAERVVEHAFMDAFAALAHGSPASFPALLDAATVRRARQQRRWWERVLWLSELVRTFVAARRLPRGALPR